MTRAYNSLGTLDEHLILPDEIGNFDRFGRKVIAKVVGEYWYASAGNTDWDDEKISKFGEVLSEDTAAGLFPTLAANYLYQG